MKKIINKYNNWVANNDIYNEWEHEDYDNVTVYENIDGDIICIERDNNGEIIDAWEA